MLVNLKITLAERRLRQWELATALGISPSTLSEIICGRREADAELRARIAALLAVEERWLFQRVVPPRATHAGSFPVLAVQS